MLVLCSIITIRKWRQTVIQSFIPKGESNYCCSELTKLLKGLQTTTTTTNVIQTPHIFFSIITGQCYHVIRRMLPTFSHSFSSSVPESDHTSANITLRETILPITLRDGAYHCETVMFLAYDVLSSTISLNCALY